MNTIDKTKAILPLYLPALLVPMAITGGLLLLYNTGMGTMYPHTLSLYSVLLSGIASFCFMIYLQKSQQHHTLTGTWYILSSISYGLCSHALIATTEYSAQIIFALLPLLILGFEAFIYHHQTKWFVIILSLALFINPITTSGIMIGLLFAFFFFTPQKKGACIADFFHLLLLYALSVCISAAVSLPTYKDQFELAAEQTYAGFSLAMPFTQFISRFLPGSIPTAYYSFFRNISLYFGLFFFFLFVLYFFHNGIARKERFKTLGFVCVILCAIVFSPLRFVFELFTDSHTAPIYFECLFLFWGVKLAAGTLPLLPQMKKLNIFSGLFSGACILLYGYAGSHLNFHPTAGMSICLFSCLYIVCLLFLWKSVRTALIEMLLGLFIFMELFCNSFLITNCNIFPTEATNSTHYIWEDFMIEDSSDSGSADTESQSPGVSSNTYHALESQYKTFVKDHYDSDLLSFVAALLTEVELTEEDREAYNVYGLLNTIEQANAACHKLGIPADLFIIDDMQYTFPDSEYYVVTEQGGNVYNLYQYATVTDIPQTYINYEFTPKENGTVVLYDNMSSTLYRFDSCNADEPQTAFLSIQSLPNYACHFRLTGCYLNTEVYEAAQGLLPAYRTLEQTAPSEMYIYYWAITLTCIGVLALMILYFNRDRDKVHRPLQGIKDKFSRLSLWDYVNRHVTANYVYYLAFSIPFILFLLSMIIFSCTPFGDQSFYEQDGLGLSLPSVLGSYYDIKNGNTLYSMNGGYGYSPYALNTIFILRFVFTLFPVDLVPALILLFLGIGYGLSSLTVAYYLTHRLSGARAHKKDYRILIPSLIYALNTYMLAYHSFPGWFYVYFAFPLLLLAMDYLMYKKAWFFYTLVLGFCMFTNLYLSLYICIFLVIYFFTYHMDSVRDFFTKGLRFAFASILAAGCNVFTILEIISTKSNSLYQNNDSIFPSPGLHGSFLEQWKQLFLFAPSTTVTADDGFVNIYMGIFTLILLGLFITSKRFSVKQKLAKLIPIAILTISFNGQVLSYIWNGFHYQSKVPNRYIFLLMFLCAVIVYDIIRELKHVPLLRHLCICILLGIFVLICRIFTTSTTLAFAATLTCILIYAICHFIYVKQKARKFPYYKVITAMVILELSANMFFTTANYNLSNITFVDSFGTVAEFANSKLDAGNTPGRIATPGTHFVNTGQFYNIPSGNFFNSYVTAYQSNMHYYYGFLPGMNYTYYNYNSTPFGLALSGHKYIFLPVLTSNTLTDTTEYNYVGQCANCHVYENPNVLSLGIYAPEEIVNLSQNVTAPIFQSELAALYTESAEPLYNTYALHLSSDVANTPNSFSYLNTNREAITFEEGAALLDEYGASDLTAISEVYLHLNLTPETTGRTYLFLNEFIPLDYGTAGTTTITDCIYPSAAGAQEEYMYVTFNETVFQEFMKQASRNQMEEVIIDNNHIYGTTRYENDGYTMLSLPYDPGWHAYVDGQEVELISPYNSFMLFQTPAGEHHIELVYERVNMKFGIGFSAGCAIFTLLLYLISRYIQKRKITTN